MQLSTSAHIDGEVVNIIPQPGPDVPDISEFRFSKFAAMYFQNNASHAYIRRALKHPLLPLRNEGDQLVSGTGTCTDILHPLSAVATVVIEMMRGRG